jgi:hypothetical protein
MSPKSNQRGPTEYDRRAALRVTLDIAIPQHLYVLAQHERFDFLVFVRGKIHQKFRPA